MQTLIVYNENEVTEQKEFQNLNSEDKIWIDLVDPTDEMLQNVVNHFHLDESTVELFTNKSKKPQIRLLDDHTFTILLDVKYKDSQTVVTEGVYLFCGKNWLITIHPAKVDLVKSTRKLLEQENKRLLKDSIDALFYRALHYLWSAYLDRP